MRALAVFLALATAPAAASGRVTPGSGFAFRYDLSTSAGRVPLTGAGLTFDPRSGEVLAVSLGVVRIFSRNGMELHAFGNDGDLAPVVAIAPLEDGSDYVAIVREVGGRVAVVRCDYRGALVARIPLSGIPEPLAATFTPTVIAVVNGRVHLGDEQRSVVVRTTLEGAFDSVQELQGVIGTGEEKGFVDPSVRGLAFDRRGNVLFTVPTLFRAFVVAPDGTSRSFGTKGSTPGKFNIVTGIAADDQGQLYVVDSLRCVVMVFDPNFEFVAQFGGRGFRAGRLILPSAVVVGDGKVYVSQGRERGVSVFAAVTP